MARNPFELGPLLLFALLFAVVATASAALAAQFGGRGLLATSVLAGTFDVDVSVLSALRLVKHSVPVETVGQAVLAALAANAIGRLSLAVFAGPVRFWLPLAGATLIAAVIAGYLRHDPAAERLGAVKLSSFFDADQGQAQPPRYQTP